MMDNCFSASSTIFQSGRRCGIISNTRFSFSGILFIPQAVPQVSSKKFASH